MGKSKSEEKIRKRFQNALLKYNITENEEDKKKNKESLIKFQDILLKSGIHLDISDDKLIIYMNVEDYTRNQTRYAGIKKEERLKEEGILSDSNFYHYSDIILMLEKMKDDEIMEEIGMKRATYYRHKKSMYESNYWRLIDKSKLSDEKYLKEQPFNLVF